MTELDTPAVLPACHAPEIASARPGAPGRWGPSAGDRALILRRARAVLDQAQQLIRQTQELVAQAQAVNQASADRRRARLHGQPSRLRPDLLPRSEYARLLAQLETMPVIEQAKGIVMAQSRCSDAEAFDLLRRASQRSNIPVRELAARLVANTVRAPEARTAGKIPEHSPARAQAAVTVGQKLR